LSWPEVPTFLALALAASLPAQDRPAEKKEPPLALVASPLGISAGATTRVLVRGLRLDEATAVRLDGAPPGAAVTLVEKGKSAAPANQPVSRAGDTQAVVEVTLPAGVNAQRIALDFASAAGDARPLPLLVDAPGSVLAEKEPNGGFATPQELACERPLEGRIEGAQDVDVYRLELAAGQTYVVELLARRLGSALDAIVTLYDTEGHEVAAVDDAPGSEDPRLELRVARSGDYLVVIQDAHDAGGPAHPYRLRVAREVMAAF
jgi:hypothetical protein